MSEPLAPGPSHLLYLHGFRSSPQSFKARRLQAWLALHRPDITWLCPQLPPSPQDAMDLIEQATRLWPASRSAVLGSSLGGFYATVLAQRRGWPMVVMNPAVDPARDLAAHIGRQTAFHDPDQAFDFEPGFVDALRRLRPDRLRGLERCLALIATGDEVLDWREMEARYAGAQVHRIEGSDHALSDFEDHLPRLLRFLSL